MPDRVGLESLTERERQCLRLVLPGFSEKGLARQLGDISPNTVKNHLKAARAKLRVSSSVAAASRLAESEGRSFPGTSTASAIYSRSVHSYLLADDEEQHATLDIVGEAPSRPFVGFDRRGEDERQPRNKLTRLMRLAVVIAILIGIILIVIAIPAIHDAFQRVANGIEPPKRREWEAPLPLGENMSNNLQSAAVSIRSDLLDAERLSEQAAAAQARLIANIIESRISIDRPIHVGSRELDRGYQALGRTLGSMRSLIVMHQGLSEVAEAEGVKAWYGTSETVPNQSGDLRAVG